MTMSKLLSMGITSRIFSLLWAALFGLACGDRGGDRAVQLIESTEDNFSGSLLELKANKAASNEFCFIEAMAGQEKVFTVTGEGDFSMHRGDLFVKEGSLHIRGREGAATFTDETSAYTAVDIKLESRTTTNFHFIKAAISPKDEPMFEVFGNGTLKVSGDITIATPINEHSLLPQVNTPRITIGKGGALVHGDIELKDASAIRLGNGGSFDVENGRSTLSNEESTTLKISRSNNIPQVEQSATVLIEQEAPSGNSAFESPHIEISLNHKTVFKVGSRGNTDINGGLVINNDVLDGSMYHEMSSRGFSGGVLELSGPSTSTQFNFITAKKRIKKSGIHDEHEPIELFAVDSEGSVYANGSIYTDNNLSVLGHVHLNGSLQFSPTKIPGGPLMVIEDISTKAFLEITEDGIARGSSSIIVQGTPLEGQLLLIKNSDSDILTGFGETNIQPWSMTLLVFLLPQGWQIVGGSPKDSETSIQRQKVAKESTSWFESFVGHRTTADDGASKAGHNERIALDGESIKGLDASEFIGDSIDFRGASVINAALVNATFDNLKHLTVDSLGIMSLASHSGNRGGSDRLVSVDNRGKLTSVAHMIWEESTKELKVSALSSFGQTDMEMRSNVDFTKHRISNFVVEPGTELENLVIKGGIIQDAIFRNVSAEGLRIGDVEMESASLKDLSQYALKGALLTVEIGGKIAVSDAFHHIGNSLLSIDKDVRFNGSVDIHNNSMVNVRIESGHIEGEKITIHAQSVSASSLILLSSTTAEEDKYSTNKLLGNGGLIMIDDNGLLKRSSINLFEGAGIGDAKVCGVLDFVKDPSSPVGHSGGSIRNAEIRGGSINGIDSLAVTGESSFDGGVDIVGDLFVNGAITVSGTVFGGGPYVDVSDVRLKRDIRKFEKGDGLLQKLQMIKGVSYVLYDDESRTTESFKNRRLNHVAGAAMADDKREIGFIAQEVEQVFPLLVYTDPKDGLKGVQYSRFVPLLVEAVNELSQELLTMKENYATLLQDNIILSRKLSRLLDDKNSNCMT